MKVGLITMHRVQNYGSALQTFALVEYIKKLGCDIKTIDYVYPNSYHIKKSLPNLASRIKLRLREILRSLLLEPFLQRNRKFKLFREKHMCLTDTTYYSKEDLLNNPPLFDIYLTGSDQVWNENKIFGDNTFFCDFAPEGKRIISFGASITTNKLSTNYKERLKSQLKKYKSIGVRERTSIPLIESLELKCGLDYLNTCDPTLLLEASDYEKLVEDSTLKVNYDYILVHQMEYNFNAEPAISDAILSAKRNFKCGVILIDHMFKYVPNGDHKVCNLGPNEFVWLFKNAKAIVTSSFHGTMFSIIYRKPFVSIAPPQDHLDGRIRDTLFMMGLTNHLIYNDGTMKEIDWTAKYSNEQEKAISNYISRSKSFLKNSLK